MRVVCLLQELIESLGWDETQAARELGMDQRSLRGLLNDDSSWRLGRETLRRLMLFAFDRGYPHGIFEIRPHALWESFRSKATPVVIVRVDNKVHDAEVERNITSFLDHFLVKARVLVNVSDVDQMRELMRTANCVVVGSPKSNPASEIAAALLWGARPFDSAETNRSLLPLQFLGTSEGWKSTSSLMRASSRNGIALTEQRGFVPVDWRPEDEYRKFTGVAQDAAAVLYCRRPLGTVVNVTTIVIAGYTGRATVRASRELTHGEPPLYDADLRVSGKLLYTVMRFKYQKRAWRGHGSLEGLRTDIEGSEVWGPPWTRLLADPDTKAAR